MSEATWIHAERRREFRRLLAFSAVAHAALFALLTLTPGSSGFTVPRGVIAVDLVAAPARPAPAARAAPPKPAPPKPPVPEKVVLPKEPKPIEPKPKPEAKLQAKVEPKPKPEPERPAEQEYTDVLAQLRAESGETAPEPAEASAAPAPLGSPSGTGRPVPPEVAAWMRRAKIHVRRMWVVPPGFRTQALETHVLVDLDASGRVVGEPRIVRRSGNPWYDEGVVRAIEKASPLPPPPAADEWAFVFVPADSF